MVGVNFFHHPTAQSSMICHIRGVSVAILRANMRGSIYVWTSIMSRENELFSAATDMNRKQHVLLARRLALKCIARESEAYEIGTQYRRNVIMSSCLRSVACEMDNQSIPRKKTSFLLILSMQ